MSWGLMRNLWASVSTQVARQLPWSGWMLKYAWTGLSGFATLRSLRRAQTRWSPPPPCSAHTSSLGHSPVGNFTGGWTVYIEVEATHKWVNQRQRYWISKSFVPAACFSARPAAVEGVLLLRWSQHPKLWQNGLSLCFHSINTTRISRRGTLFAVRSPGMPILTSWLHGLRPGLVSRGSTLSWRRYEVVATGGSCLTFLSQLKMEGWIHHLGRHSVACFLTR